jgi:N utilization substance protein A
VRLASQLTGWDIDIVSESEDSERRQREFKELTELFTSALNVDEVIAQLLATEGITSIEELAAVPEEELARIEGFDEEIAAALKERALSWLEERRQALEAEARELGVADDLLTYDRLDLESIVKLARQGVKSLEDLADLAGDELAEMLPGSGLDAAAAGEIVMDARVRLGWIEPPAAADEREAAASA